MTDTAKSKPGLTHGNLSQATKLLGVNRTTLYSRMQTYQNG